MRTIEVTPFTRAQRYIGQILERPGQKDNHPLIQWWLSLCGYGFDAQDEVPWCSAFVNGIAWDLRLARSKSAAARSWLEVGTPVRIHEPLVGWDVVVIKRGSGAQPGPEVIKAQGHVGFFAGFEGANILILGGNQDNRISIERFSGDKILGIRRL